MYKSIKKIRRTLVRHQWIVIAVLGTAAFGLGCLGFSNYYKMTGERRSLLDVAYLSVQLFALQIGDMPGIKSWEFEAARWLAPATAAYALILAAASIFYEQIKLVRLLLLKKHVIICGLGNIGSMLASRFLSGGRSVVIIEPDHGNPALDRFRAEGAIIINGNPTERHVLKQAGIRKASHLIAITDDDGINTEIAVQTNGLTRKNKNNLSSFIHISNNKLCNFFQVNGFQNEDEAGANIEFFNFFHIGAKLLLNKYPLKETNNAEGRHDRVLIIGLGRIGENLIVDLARSWQKTFRESNARLKITVVDVDAKNKIDVIKVGYPGLEKICDIAILQLDINSAEFLKAGFLFDEKGGCMIDKIYICLKIDSECMLSALRLSALTSAANVPIIVKMNNSGGLGAVLQNKNYETGVFKNVRLFNFLEETCVPEHLINGNFERLARAFHGEYINIHGRMNKSEIKVDAELADWKNLSEDYKNSNLALAKNVFVVLKRAGYKVAILNDWEASFEFESEEIVKMASALHELWIEERIGKGWAYAPGVKNDHARTNPYLISYNDLPDREKQFNLDIIKMLPGLFNRIGIQIELPKVRKKPA